MIPSTARASRWRATVALAAITLLSVAGCQARAGSAAIVGSSRITDDQVRQVAQEGLRVKTVSTAVGSDIGGYRQLILGRLLKHLLVADAARKLGVSVSQGQLDTTLKADVQRLGGRAQLDAALAAAPLKLPPSELRPFLRDSLLLNAMGDRFTTGLTFSDAEAKKFYDVNGGAQSGRSFAQLKPQVLAALRQQRGVAKAEAYVQQYLRSRHVTVNPRYGRFDQAKLFDPNEASVIVGAKDDLVRDSTATRS